MIQFVLVYRKHKCEHCDKSFHIKNALTIHMRKLLSFGIIFKLEKNCDLVFQLWNYK